MIRTPSIYSLKKSRHILKLAYKYYQKQRIRLSLDQLHHFEYQLQQLDEALLSKHREEANRLAHQVEEFCNTHFKKGMKAYLAEMIFAILVALIVATIVRQTWFELYEIPTGFNATHF